MKQNMKKKGLGWLIIAIAALIVLGALLWNRNKDAIMPQQENTYTDVTNEFAFSYPESWSVVTGNNTNNELVVSVVLPSDNTYLPGFNVSRQELPAGDTLQTFVQKATQGYPERIANYTMLGSSNENVDGNDAIGITFEGMLEETSYKWEQRYTLHNDTVYVITYLSPASEFDTHRGEIEEAFDTFSFRN